MIPVISIYGFSGSGKTSLLVKIIPLLKEKGYRVAVIKHAHHGFDIDIPGKDSYKFAQAGSDIIALSSPDRMAIIEKREPEYTLEELILRISDKADIILVEGFKQQGTLKLDAAKYGENDIGNIIDFLEKQIAQQKTVTKNE